MRKTTQLEVIKNKPDPDVVSTLEQLLEDAKAGRLLEFTLVGRYESHQVINSRAGETGDVFTMYGKLMDLAMQYRERNIA